MRNLITSRGGLAASNIIAVVAISAAIALMCLLTPMKCSAQAGENTLENNKNEFGAWAGSSLGLPSALGGSRDRKIPILIGLRYGRVLSAGKYAALEYTLDVVPVGVVSGPKGGFSNPGGVASPGGGRDYAYGAGVIPVGFKMFVAPQHRIKPYVTVSSGPFYFSKQVPVPNSAQFNFLSTGGGGVQIFLSARRAISIEYRVGHLSNAGVGNLNPGFNSSTIHVGFSVFR
jgi:hypothetical protein